MKSKFLYQDVDVVSLADKGIVVRCFVCRNYDKVLMETGKLCDNIRVTKMFSLIIQPHSHLHIIYPLFGHFNILWPCYRTRPHYRVWPCNHIPSGLHRTFTMVVALLLWTPCSVLSKFGLEFFLMLRHSLQNLSGYRTLNFEYPLSLLLYLPIREKKWPHVKSFGHHVLK